VTEKKTSPKTKTSTTEPAHESGTKDPAKKGANVTIEAAAYDELAKTAGRFRWTVPQYIGFLAEATALKNEKERIRDVWGALDTNTEEQPAPATTGDQAAPTDLAGALA
jgi:hypothetical protein